MEGLQMPTEGMEEAAPGGDMPFEGMEEAAPGGGMPTGEMEDDAVASEMPAISMGSPEGTMPAPGMGESSSAGAEMPTGGMEEAAPEGEMPAGGMEEGESGFDRFRSTNLPPDEVPPTVFEPGVVEVEFREGVRPQITPPTEDAPSAIASPAEVNLEGLNQILQRNQLERAESTFQISEKAAAQTQAIAQQQDVAVPNLRNFVTLHFPAEADTQGIAHELSRLPEVERAVAIPKAIPPQTPLNEPLVGSTDQVVLNPVTHLENQWYIFRCRTNHAWTMSSGDGVVIADIDWGFRTSHQDLSSRLDMGHAYNAYDGGTNVSTGGSVSHGTAVMGIAGAADNNLGMGGFAFGATLWPVQADSGPGTALGGNAWARAIDWVRTSNSSGRRKVIILEVQTGSFGNYEMVPSVNAAIRTAIALEVIELVRTVYRVGAGYRKDPVWSHSKIVPGASKRHGRYCVRFLPRRRSQFRIMQRERNSKSEKPLIRTCQPVGLSNLSW